MKSLTKEKKLKGKLIVKDKDKYIIFNNEVISKKRKDVVWGVYDK